MKNTINIIICAASMALLFGTAQDDGQPKLPQNHPSIPTTRQTERPTADTADIQSIDAVINAYYDVIGGPPDEKRDWNRFLSLFTKDARFHTARQTGQRVSPVSMTPDEFARFSDAYFKSSGYSETEIHRRVDVFGNIAQVLSTYEARHGDRESKPYSRGVYSIQLLGDGKRWWIVSIMWDHEREGDNIIGPEYLPAGSGEAPDHADQS